jgi:CBS domain-containing protein
MKVSFILKGKGGQVFSIAPDASLMDALSKMLEHTIGSLVVLDVSGDLAGILSERDMLRAVHDHPQDWADIKVSAYMTTQVLTTNAKDKVNRAMDTMTNNRIRHLPVLDDGGKLVGVLSIGDIIKANLAETAYQNELLKNYIKNWPQQG